MASGISAVICYALCRCFSGDRSDVEAGATVLTREVALVARRSGETCPWLNSQWKDNFTGDSARGGCALHTYMFK